MGKKQIFFDIQSTWESAAALHQQGEFSRAANLYGQILQHCPDIAGIHYNLGLARYELEDYAGAIEAYLRASELQPHDGDILYNLGLAYKMNKQYDMAEEAYLNALECADDATDILYNLACCYQDSDAIDSACYVFEQLLKQRPDHLSALNNLAYLHHLQANYEQARELYGRVLALDPERQSARFMYKTLSGETSQAPPQDYVRALFDRYSEKFEENLIRDLEYRTYKTLRRAFDNLSRKKTLYQHGLDLGCGTGLAGVEFHPACAKLTGIDLSRNMLALAGKKQVYNYLHCTDIIEFLEQTGHSYDLVFAADVLPYLGNLAPLFAALDHRVAQDAVFCLSSEKTESQAWKVQCTGRYAHNPDYIAKTASRHGWKVLDSFEEDIRKENNKWIRGTIFVLGRKT